MISNNHYEPATLQTKLIGLYSYKFWTKKNENKIRMEEVSFV